MISTSNDSVKVVHCNQVYNLQLFEIHLIIDTRSKSLFDKEHIETAVSFEPQADFSTQQVIEFLYDYEKNYGTPSILNPVIIYGYSHTDPFLLNVTNTLVQFLKFSSLNDQIKITKQLKQWAEQFLKQTKEIWILENGFDSMKSHFPYCIFPNALDVPFPLLISDCIYWGSRNFKLCDKNLKMMNVSHLILDSNTFDYHRFSIPITLFEANVSNLSNIETMFRMAADFIDEALLEGNPTILVNLYGRSTSAAIIIAWMILKKGISFINAIHKITSLYSRLDEKQMFLDVLKQLDTPKAIL